MKDETDKETFDIVFEDVTPRMIVSLGAALEKHHSEAHEYFEAGLATENDISIAHNLMEKLVENDEAMAAATETAEEIAGGDDGPMLGFDGDEDGGVDIDID